MKPNNETYPSLQFDNRRNAMRCFLVGAALTAHTHKRIAAAARWSRSEFNGSNNIRHNHCCCFAVFCCCCTAQYRRRRSQFTYNDGEENEDKAGRVPRIHIPWFSPIIVLIIFILCLRSFYAALCSHWDIYCSLCVCVCCSLCALLLLSAYVLSWFFLFTIKQW